MKSFYQKHFLDVQEKDKLNSELIRRSYNHFIDCLNQKELTFSNEKDKLKIIGNSLLEYTYLRINYRFKREIIFANSNKLFNIKISILNGRGDVYLNIKNSSGNLFNKLFEITTPDEFSEILNFVKNNL